MKQNTVAMNNNVDVREDMKKKLAAFLQFFLTWLTGKPYPGQQPLVKRSNLSYLFAGYFKLLLGLSISTFAHIHGAWFWLPLGWLLTVSGARELATVVNHYLVHRDFLPVWLREKYSWLNPYIGDFNSAVLGIQNFAEYAVEHLLHHGRNIMASIIDPDMIVLWSLGIRTGMSKAKLWSTFIFNLLFPFSKLHLLFIKARIKDVLTKGNWFRRFVQIITLALLIALVIHTSFATVFWAWIFPMTYLYHMAALMQFCSEHFWLTDVKEDGCINTSEQKAAKERIHKLTAARHLGEAVPSYSPNMVIRTVLWAKWIVKMLFIHLPLRLFVLPGDLVVHNFHHFTKPGIDWANGFYLLADRIAHPKENDAPFLEVWGMANAIDNVFDNLSKMHPIYPNQSDIDNETVLGM